MRNKVNTWPGWNGNTRYPRLRSAVGWWPITVVYWGSVRRGLRGARHGSRGGEAPRCRAVSILYQYEIQTDGLGVKGTERAGAQPCDSVLCSLRSPRKPNAPSKPPRDVEREKNVKSRDRMLSDREIFVQLTVTAIPNSADYLQSIYYHITFSSIILFV